MIKFYVVDEAQEIWSPGYSARWKAEKDLEENISHKWSNDAKVIEVEEI
jgi:hypothetical protein